VGELSFPVALLIGLLGSSHCLAMCGGMSSLLFVGQPSKQCSGGGRVAYLLSYNIGRLLTYSMLGALLGLLGERMASSLPGMGLILRTMAGLLLIAMGLYVSQWWMGLTQLEKAGAYLWRYVQPLTVKLLPVNNHSQALLLGSLWGLLPCGLVYSTLSWALAAADWRQSALLMFAFGLGTLPAMLSMGFVNEKLLRHLRTKNTRRLAGMLIIVMGIMTIAVPWYHSQQHGGHTMKLNHEHKSTHQH